MAKKLNLNQVLEIRYKYFDYVYRHYIYNVFTELNRQKTEQTILAMEEHNNRPEILKNYLANEKLNKSQREVLESWKNEIYGNMHIIHFDRNKVFVYCEETDQVYHVFLLDAAIKVALKSFPFYVPMHGTIFNVYGKLYFDNIVNIQSRYDESLKHIEELYEHIYDIFSKDQHLLSKSILYTFRNLEQSKFSNIFLDYLGPLGVLSMNPDDLEQTIKTGMLVWNSEIVKEIDLSMIDNRSVIQFLRTRKQKYFSNINRILVDYDIIYDADGFEIITKSQPI